MLFTVSRDRRRWIRKHLWLIALTVAVILGVVFAIGPVQLLRLLRVFGALRLVRVGRIVQAGRIMRQRMGLEGFWAFAPAVLASLLMAAFVGVVLADPTLTDPDPSRGLGGTHGRPPRRDRRRRPPGRGDLVVIRQQQDNRTDATWTAAATQIERQRPRAHPA